MSNKIGVENVVVCQQFFGIIDDLSVGQDEHARYTDLFGKVRVVTYEQDRTRVIAEVFADYRLRVGIEMVSRFVQYQKIGAREQQLAQRNARFFPGGERRNFFEYRVALKKEIAELIDRLTMLQAHL